MNEKISFDEAMDRLLALPPGANVAGMDVEDAINELGKDGGKVIAALANWGRVLPAESPVQARYRIQREGKQRYPRGAPRSQK